MKSAIYRNLFAMLLCMVAQIAFAQDDLIDKLEEQQPAAEQRVGEGILLAASYFDIVVAGFILWWAVQAFRKSRAHTDEDDGESFSLIKWGGPKMAIIILYSIVRFIIVPGFFN